MAGGVWATGIAVVLLTGTAAGLPLPVPASGGMACSFAAEIVFEPPLTAEPGEGVISLQVPDSETNLCAGAMVGCLGGPSACAGVFPYPSDGFVHTFDYAGTCQLAVVTEAADPDGNVVGVVLEGATLLISDPFSLWIDPDIRVPAGHGSWHGHLAAAGGNACDMSSAACACSHAFLGVLPP